LNKKAIASTYIKNHLHEVVGTYKPTFHFSPPIGWLNDPNGLSLFKGFYHLFYQYNPYDSIWGPMHWGHAISKDFIKWEHVDIARFPKNLSIDGGAAFSGSAIEKDGLLYLLYTEHWKNKQVQKLAYSQDGLTFYDVSKKPVITSKKIPNLKDYIKKDFRDPKIIKKDNMFYALIGIKEVDLGGALVLFKSMDLMHWDFVNVAFRSLKSYGHMFECPDLLSFSNQDVLIVSPQYLKSEGEQFTNVHSSLFVYGHMNFDQGVFSRHHVSEIDFGLDFYAPQTFVDDKNRIIMIAWMDMWERSYPTHELNHKWSGVMSFPRELKWMNNQVIQQPVAELMHYRTNHRHKELKLKRELSFDDIKGNTLELIVHVKDIKPHTLFHIDLLSSLSEYTRVSYAFDTSTFTFDRSNSEIPIKNPTQIELNSNIRTKKVDLIEGVIKIHIIIDVSSIELFLQDGLYTSSNRVFPKSDSQNIKFYSNQEVDVTIDVWDIDMNKIEGNIR
jgi:beta-fructofuranosidase